MNKAQIDKLRVDIRCMTNQTALYKMLKEELTRLGCWKNRPRGNARKGYSRSPIAQQVTQIRQQLKDSTVWTPTNHMRTQFD